MNTRSHASSKTAAVLALAGSTFLAGCASTTPDYDARFGEAVQRSLQAQVINPRAGDSPDPVLGLDGGAAREAAQRYRESFKAPPPVVNVINIGGTR